MSDMNIPEEQAVEADLPVREADEADTDELEAVENTSASKMPPG